MSIQQFIEQMTDSEYIEKRLDDQQKWHSNKSVRAQKYYKRLQFAQYVCLGFIPILTIVPLSIEWIKSILISALSLAAAVCIFCCRLGNFHEIWLRYRLISEALLRERYLYLTQTAPYDDLERYAKLVTTCESLLSELDDKWENATRSIIASQMSQSPQNGGHHSSATS